MLGKLVDRRQIEARGSRAQLASRGRDRPRLEPGAGQATLAGDAATGAMRRPEAGVGA